MEGLLGSLQNALQNQWQQGEPYRVAVGGLLSGDTQPMRGLLNTKTKVNPMTVDDAMQIAMDWGPMGMVGHTVYHGSPHKFTKFDMNKIGTGEGAQAYGHGLYFAESPGVAKSYQERLGNLEWKSPEAAARYDPATLRDLEKELVHKSKDEVMRLNKQYADHAVETGRGSVMADMYNALSRGDIKAGNLYKVDLPDEVIPKMLDWDKPFKEQPLDVQKAIKKSSFYKDARALHKQSGQWYYDPSQKTGEGLLKYLRSGTTDVGGGSEQYGMAEDYLKSLGIPGIRYLDGGSRGAGQGSYNYVVFDDGLPKILEINGQPLR